MTQKDNLLKFFRECVAKNHRIFNDIKSAKDVDTLVKKICQHAKQHNFEFTTDEIKQLIHPTVWY